MTTIKRFLTLSLIAALAVQVWAVPAYRGWRTMTQPDGTTITIRQMGDEFFHYWENEAGQQVEEDEQGYWHVLEKPAVPSELQKQLRVSRKYNQSEPGKPHKVGGINLAPRGLVILVNFTDVTFKSTNTRAAMSDLMNSENYTYNSATGSVREFFKAQSNGQYVPDFDVVGPYDLAYNRAHYGANSGGSDVLAADMIVEACKAADADGVNFNLYNNDGDTYVDFVYVIYAGVGEADASPKVANAIWPHNWTISSARYYNQCSYTASQCKVDGLSINNYACSGEMEGTNTYRCPIGTITHEFGHVLGLPDYYVTDEDASNEGKNYTPGAWHIMDYGSYNNEGRTPPNYTPHDKYFFGWSTPTLLAKDDKKNCTLTTTYGSAYQITGGTTLKGATASDRVWYLENRQKSGWDKYLPGHGMVVWEVTYNSTNWNDNEPNNENIGYTLVTANSLTRPYTPCVYTTTASSTSGTTFPGTSNVTSYTPATGCALTNITESAGNITFKYNGGVSSTTWDYTLYGDHCTYPADGTVLKNAALNLTITPASGYTLADESCWEVSMGGSALTYGTGFTYNPGTGAFSIASVTGDVEILVEGLHPVTWSANGSTHATNVAVDGKITLPANPEDCSETMKFVGWCSDGNYSSQNTAPTFAKTGDTYSVATYYAVYATPAPTSAPMRKTAAPAKASSIAVGDRVVFVCESASKEMTSIGSYGEGTTYSGTPAGTYVFDVEAGSSEGTFSFKNGTDYISWSSGNSLGKSSTKNASSSWNVSFSSENTIITNASDASRKLQWNAGSPRFACYTSSQTAIQLYKMPSATSYTDYTTVCQNCTLTGITLTTSGVKTTFVTNETFTSEGLVVTASYSDCDSKTVTPNSVSSPDMSTTGGKTVTVSYTEGGETKTATYNITVVAPYTVTYMACGDVFTTQEYAPGATLVLPTETLGANAGMVFEGWTATEHYTGVSAPELISAGSAVNANATYYAVFH